MKLIVLGVCLMLAGLTLLLAMVIRLLEPGFGLSLFSYASVFGGMLLGLAGVIKSVSRRS